jgi:hypothetical protein
MRIVRRVVGSTLSHASDPSSIAPRRSCVRSRIGGPLYCPAFRFALSRIRLSFWRFAPMSHNSHIFLRLPLGSVVGLSSPKACSTNRFFLAHHLSFGRVEERQRAVCLPQLSVKSVERYFKLIINYNSITKKNMDQTAVSSRGFFFHLQFSFPVWSCG